MHSTHIPNRTSRIIFYVHVLIFMLINPVAATEDLSGMWKGAVVLPGTELEFIIVLTADDQKEMTGSIDIPAQGAKNLPLVDFSVDLPDISFKIQGVPGDPTFYGKLSSDGKTIQGNFIQGEQTFPFSMAKDDFVEQELRAQRRAEKLANITVFIDTTREVWNVPGLAIAIVKDDEVIYSGGFGHRNIEGNLPVTPNTIFAIGSSTKAFTALGLGILVDDGKLDLDKPVHEYLPDFRLYNRFATEKMTPRDLVTHRSGLPRHDLMWYGSGFTSEEMYKRLRYLQPSKDFRETWQYQNLMYMTAGYLIEQISGNAWEDFTRERIFTPLGMERSNFSVDVSARASDHARPYRLNDEKVPDEIPFRNISEIGPAGSINSSVAEMANWVKLNLSGGQFDDTTVVSSSVLQDMHTPHMVLSSISPHRELINHIHLQHTPVNMNIRDTEL